MATAKQLAYWHGPRTAEHKQNISKGLKSSVRARAYWDRIKGSDRYSEQWRASLARGQRQAPEPGTDRFRRRACRFGLTVEQLEAMHHAQRGECAICSQPWTVVDHDHATGSVRGLLCRKCNSALGFLQDSYAIACKAAFYLADGRRLPEVS